MRDKGLYVARPIRRALIVIANTMIGVIFVVFASMDAPTGSVQVAKEWESEVTKMKAGRIRTREEVEPIVTQLSEDLALVEQIRAAVGSGNKELVSQTIDEVTKRAITLDPTMGIIEGTSIAVELVERLDLYRRGD